LIAEIFKPPRIRYTEFLRIFHSPNLLHDEKREENTESRDLLIDQQTFDLGGSMLARQDKTYGVSARV